MEKNKILRIKYLYILKFIFRWCYRVKVSEWLYSIILGAFLGYLWLIFIGTIIDLANSIDNIFIGGLIILLGTGMFYEISDKVIPKNEKKKLAPIKILGYTSFASIVLIHFLIVDLI